MEKNENPQKILKTQVYNRYLECVDNPNADNIILLCDLVYKWCRKYSFRKRMKGIGGEIYTEAENLAVDICDFCNEWVKEKKYFKNKNLFFGYLKEKLKFKLIEIYRNCPKGIKTSKEKITIWNEFEKQKAEKENSINRKLKTCECEEIMSEVMKSKRKKNKNYYAEYHEYINRKDTIAFSALCETDDEGGSVLNIQDKRTRETFSKLWEEFNINVISDAVRDILEKENNQCLNDLLTVKYKGSDIDLLCLSEYKNNDIIISYKESGQAPNLKDIYLKYYNVQSDSAGPCAAQMIKTFEEKLRKKTKKILSSR